MRWPSRWTLSLNLCCERGPSEATKPPYSHKTPRTIETEDSLTWALRDYGIRVNETVTKDSGDRGLGVDFLGIKIGIKRKLNAWKEISSEITELGLLSPTRFSAAGHGGARLMMAESEDVL